MQKISTYLYPNRIRLLADLAGFTTEYTNVYQRQVKIYNGIDNTLEFDVKNADQKRIDLTDYTLEMNIMDAMGNALPNSPYPITKLDQTATATKGLAKVVIPKEDLECLDKQYFKFNVVGFDTDNNDVIFYADSRFGGVGTIELINNFMPTCLPTRTYNSFTAEIDLKGVPTYHTSAIPAKFYEAVPTEYLTFNSALKGFTGSIWIEGTKKSTINAEAFKGADYLDSYTFDSFTGNWQTTQTVGDYQYFRISYTTPTANGLGANFSVTLNNNAYDVELRAGGTGYAVGSQIKVLGSVLGGVDGINDLIITVTHVDASTAGFTSSYAVSSITNFTSTGTAANGDATYIATGTNITGTVDNVTVS